jgi:sterol desaturase/sphingolipid hydroxylase (fatty acid hydroxylase superfamily)
MQVIVTTLGEAQVLAYVAGLLLFVLWESMHPFFDFFRSSSRTRTLHIVKNLVLGAINSAVIAVVFAAAWVAASVWAERIGFGLLNVLAGFGMPTWAHTVGAILLLDAWTYVWHRMNHRIPFLWRFHRVHHADNQMDVSTAGRFHVGEIIFSSVLRIPLIALLGVYAWELLLYETIMFAVVQFQHANIGVPPGLDRALRSVIVTPAMHKVHHSRLQPETDSNYSALFSFWDRLARSFRLRPDPHDINFGLSEFDDPRHETLGGLLRMPLQRTRSRDLPA